MGKSTNTPIIVSSLRINKMICRLMSSAIMPLLRGSIVTR